MKKSIVLTISIMALLMVGPALYAAQVPRTITGILPLTTVVKPLLALPSEKLVPIVFGDSKDAPEARLIYVERQQSFLKAIPEKNVRAQLTHLLTYQPKANERFNKFGNIIREYPGGHEVAFEGYAQQKQFYELLQKMPHIETPEIEALKARKDEPLEKGAFKEPPTPEARVKQYEPMMRPVEMDPSLVPDPLNAINPDFFRLSYNPQGFMYWADELYAAGIFPFLPYLTKVKNQGSRGSCMSFGMLGAAEILSMDRPDLSEQNHYFHRLYQNDLMFNGEAIGAESEWPYNVDHCTDGSYRIYTKRCINPLADPDCVPEYTDYPCSDTDHQGIPLPVTSGAYMPYAEVIGTTQGRCTRLITDVLEGIPHDMRARAQHLGAIVNNLKYPVALQIPMSSSSAPGPDGMCVDQNCFDFSGWQLLNEEGEVEGLGHALLIVAYIPKEDIPDAVKQNPNFVPNENYFILKNSWGTNYGDRGFIYVPEIMLGTYNFEHCTMAFKYDNEGLLNKNCPPRASAGVE